MRAEAQAESKSALGSAKFIIGVFLVVYVILFINPAGRAIFASGAIKIELVLVAFVVWGLFGWFVIRKLVEEAVR